MIRGFGITDNGAREAAIITKYDEAESRLLGYV